jgi:hypothetical protein
VVFELFAYHQVMTLNGVHMRRTFGTALVMMMLAAAVHAQQPAERRTAAPLPAPAAQAQPPGERKTAAPLPASTARPRVGYAASPAPEATSQPIVNQPVVINQPAYFTTNGFTTTGAPYLVLSDGSVAVNFGNGYERVLRPCAAASTRAPADPYARDALGRIPEPPGIAALRQGGRGQIGGTMPAQNAAACYRTDAQGRPEIVNGR